MEQYRYKYKGYSVHDSECVIRIFKQDDINFILFEDLGMGTSVTNASEQLATEIVKLEDLNPDECRFFETYPYDNNLVDIDEINYIWDGKNASNPSWKHIENKEIYKNFKLL